MCLIGKEERERKRMFLLLLESFFSRPVNSDFSQYQSHLILKLDRFHSAISISSTSMIDCQDANLNYAILSQTLPIFQFLTVLASL